MGKFLLTIIATILFTLSTNAKNSLSVVDYDVTNYPNIRASYFLFGANSLPLSGLQANQFETVDNGLKLNINSLQSPQDQSDKNVSFLILFDLNLSKSKGNLDKGKAIVKSLFDKIDFNNSEAALISYDINAYLHQKFTNDKQKLELAANQFVPYIVSDANAAFFGEPLGAFKTINKAKGRKVIILITDTYTQVDDTAIASFAKANNVQINVIELGREIPSSLLALTKETNGNYFDKVQDTNKLEDIAKILLAYSYKYQPITIEFKAKINCIDDHNVDIRFLQDSAMDSFNYQLVDSIKPRIVSNPPFVRFSSVIPSTYRDIPIVITAKSSDIKVLSIKLENDNNGIFSLLNVNNSQILDIPVNTSHSFTIRFQPVDSAIVFTRILIESDACYGDEILVTGGFPNTPPNTKTLKVLTPSKCDETLVAGDTYSLDWTGLLPKDVISIEYSIDGGLKWDTISPLTLGLSYAWKVPARFTQNGLIRIIQIWPNNIGRTLDLNHPKNPNIGTDIKYQTYTAFFNREGTKIVTTCEDNNIRIWDATFGNIDMIMSEHNDKVNSAEFSSDDQFIVSCSDDRNAIIWNAYTGKSIKRLPHPGFVRSAKYSPDGKKIVTACSDGRFRLYDSGGNLTFTSPVIDSRGLRYAMFSPKTNTVVVSTLSAEIRKFSAIDNVQINPVINLKSNGGSFSNQFDISPDEKKLIASENVNSKQASVWDFQTGAVLKTIRHITYYDTGAQPDFETINYASFHYTDLEETFITSGWDKRSLQWDANTYDSLKEFKEHTNNVVSTVFNFDGSRALTASWDGIAKIWNLNERDLQIDTNDCFFRIDKAEMIAKSIDFGDVVNGFEKDTTVNDLIQNLQSFGYKIYNIEIKGANKDEFKLLNSTKPKYIDSLGKIGAELIFLPNGIGLREATLEIQVPGKTITANLRGISLVPSVSLVEKYVDFGEVEVGDFKDKSTQYVLKNNTASDINLDTMFISVPDSRSFRFINSKSNILKPQEGVEVSLRFIPLENGDQNSTAFFEFQGNNSPLKIPMVGFGLAAKPDTASINLQNVSGAPGDIINLPIVLKKVSENPLDLNLKGIKTFLRFNATMLEPISGFISSRIEEGDRIIELDLQIPDDKKSQILSPNNEIEIGSVRFKVALGNDTLTNLSLENLSPIGDSKINVDVTNANFSLNGYCKEGGVVRLFDGKGKLALSQNSPNPADIKTEIEFELLEKGSTKLYIMDGTGKIIKYVIDKDMAVGKHKIEFSVADLPSGSYFYVLTTPSQEVIRRMQINK